MAKLDIDFLSEVCRRAIYYAHENAQRGDEIASTLGSMWYEKGRLVGYMTAFNLDYSDDGNAITIRNGKKKIVLRMEKEAVVGGAKNTEQLLQPDTSCRLSKC